ncbi:hypothetical protein Efla_004744 [Eimeria flavescens]
MHAAPAAGKEKEGERGCAATGRGGCPVYLDRGGPQKKPARGADRQRREGQKGEKSFSFSQVKNPIRIPPLPGQAVGVRTGVRVAASVSAVEFAKLRSEGSELEFVECVVVGSSGRRRGEGSAPPCSRVTWKGGSKQPPCCCFSRGRGGGAPHPRWTEEEETQTEGAPSEQAPRIGAALEAESRGETAAGDGGKTAEEAPEGPPRAASPQQTQRPETPESSQRGGTPLAGAPRLVQLSTRRRPVGPLAQGNQRIGLGGPREGGEEDGNKKLSRQEGPGQEGGRGCRSSKRLIQQQQQREPQQGHLFARQILPSQRRVCQCTTFAEERTTKMQI